jgi:hypothetical protein
LLQASGHVGPVDLIRLRFGIFAGSGSAGGSKVLAGALRLTKLVWKVTPNIAVLPRSQAALTSIESVSLNTAPRLIGESCLISLSFGSCL